MPLHGESSTSAARRLGPPRLLQVQGLKDLMGFNLAAMQHLQRWLKERQLAPADPAAALLPLKRKAEA